MQLKLADTDLCALEVFYSVRKFKYKASIQSKAIEFTVCLTANIKP